MFGRRVLILIPHPDDEVVGCCAAIARAREQGAEVFGLFLTTGVSGREVLWPWERSRQPLRVTRRRAEARRVAELVHLEVVQFGEIPARQLSKHIAPTLAAIRDLVRRLEADTLWAPAYEGGHQDHDVANFTASRLSHEVPVWEFAEYNLSGGRLHSQEFIELNGSEQRLHLSAAEQELKRRALGFYESERRNLGFVRTETEVLRPLARYDYSVPAHVGKLYYQRYQWVPFSSRVDYTQPADVCRAIAAAEHQER